MIIQAELRRKQSEYEGEACSVDKVIELPARGSNSSAAHCWLTMISSQRIKTPSGTMMIPDTVCSSSTRMERTVSLLTHRGTTTPGTVPLSPTPAVC